MKHSLALLCISAPFLVMSMTTAITPIYAISLLALYLAYALPQRDIMVWAIPLSLFAVTTVLAYHQSLEMLLYNMETFATVIADLLFLTIAIVAGRRLQSKALPDLLDFMILFIIVKWAILMSVPWFITYPDIDMSLSPVHNITHVMPLLWAVSYNLVFIMVLTGTSEIIRYIDRSRIWI